MVVENLSVSERDLADALVEFWKLENLCERLLTLIDQKQAKRLRGQLAYSAKQIEALAGRLEMRVLTFEGDKFVDGMPMTADNLDEIDESQPVEISKAIEPTVVRNGRTIKLGRVILSSTIQSKEY